MLTKGTRGDTMLYQICKIVEEIRNEHPCESELDGKIYYMNGNDGTDFDWDMNDRLCEFMVFHENEFGYIKMCVNKDNTIDVYVFPDGGWHPMFTIKRTYRGNVCAFKDYMMDNFDACDIWDESIDKFLEND